MPRQKVILLADKEISQLGYGVINFFNANYVDDYTQLKEQLSLDDCRALVVDDIGSGFNADYYRELFRLDCFDVDVLPVILFVDETSLENKILACELGFDDVVVSSSSTDDANARITKAIFHKIASRQLLSARELNNRERLSVRDQSQYNATIDFLLQIHDCDNLDQLGQLFFSLMGCYQLVCSLQMRSAMGQKDMEPHGMSKDLESELLFGLSHITEDFNFGKQTIVCFRDVSILVHNMPIGDEEEYRAIKSMIRVLAKGLSARVSALDNRYQLLREKDMVCQFTQEMQYAVKMMTNSHREVIERVLVQLEFVSSSLSETISAVDVTGVNKTALEGVLNQCREHIRIIVKDDPTIENSCSRLEYSISNMLSLLGMPNDDSIRKKSLLNR